MKELIGKTINKVYLSRDKTVICFETDTGNFVYTAEGDCCSYSWIEHFINLDWMLYKKITNIEKLDLPDVTDQYYKSKECVQAYGVKLLYENGEAIIEFRNESNGYYGGWLEYRENYDTNGKEELFEVEEDF